jgi:ATP-binding cassette subfamily C protein CydD
VQAFLLAHVLHEAIVAGQPPGSLALPIAGILGLVAGRALLGWAAESLAVTASEAIKRDLRERLFADLLGRPVIWTSGQSSGVLSTALVEHVEALDGFFVRYLPAMVQAAVLPLAVAALVLPFDWVAGGILLLTAPLIPVFMMLAGWGAEAASRAQARAMNRLAGRFADRLRGLVTLKLFGRAEAEIAAIHEASEELRRRTMKVMRIAFLSSATLEFFAALGVAGVALYCGLTLLGLVHLRAAPLTLEAALFALLMAPEVYQPLRLLAAHYHDRAAAKAGLATIVATLGEAALSPAPVAVPAPVAAAPLHPTNRSAAALRLAGFSLATPAGTPLLTDAELTVAPGEHVAIIGESGIGKSTLLEGLARLRPFTGTVTLDGRPLETIDEPTLRAETSLVGQRPRLFAGTIADNIRLARPDADPMAVAAAARRAMVSAFAECLPEGLDTKIGENGLGLSGGEAQRVALARLYLRDPRLILLDEPTSHLDWKAERQVLDGLMAFASGRTLLVATHSEAVAARMDRVFRIVHRQLLPAPRPRVWEGLTERGAA